MRLRRRAARLAEGALVAVAAACAGATAVSDTGVPVEAEAPPVESRPSPVVPSSADAAPVVVAEVVVEQLPEPTAASPERHPDVLVCAGGDVTLGTNLDTAWAPRAAVRLGIPVPALPDPYELLAPLKPLVADADLLLLNVEGAIGEGPAPPKCRPGSTSCYAFRQPLETAAALRDIAPGASVVGNVANNHALDAGVEGWRATSRHLGFAGAYVTGVDTVATIVPVRDGRDTVAVLGFSTSQAGPDPRDLAAVRRHVERAASRYPMVVVTMHMGAEGVDAQRTMDRTERYLGEDRGNVVAFARTAVGAGALLVVGHGPHVLRAAERRDRAVVLYSLGNLLTYGPFSLREPLNRGAIACVRLSPTGSATDVILRPTVQKPPGTVAPDPTGRGAALVDSLSRADFPTSALQLYVEAVSRSPRFH